MKPDRASILASVCSALDTGSMANAADILRREYPFEPVEAVERKYGAVHATRVFCRDGFIDRYTGARLVFPGALRALSLQLPTDFPFHPNWKMSVTHEAFWELSPTVDHLVPVTRGGADDDSNWVTTSMLRNSAKSNWTLEDLGWELHPPGQLADWDGLIGWFVRHVQANPGMLGNGLIARWHRAAVKARAA